MEHEEEPDKETMEEWQKDPSNWILGIFYFNKKDKRIFPPKRVSVLGWTINFANPYSIITIGAILLILFIIAYSK
jgi:uncharacterized membrane protein